MRSPVYSMYFAKPGDGVLYQRMLSVNLFRVGSVTVLRSQPLVRRNNITWKTVGLKRTPGATTTVAAASILTVQALLVIWRFFSWPAVCYRRSYFDPC